MIGFGVLLHVFLLIFVLHTFAAVFAFAPNFNSDISKWDTSAVTSMTSSKYSTKTIYFLFFKCFSIFFSNNIYFISFISSVYSLSLSFYLFYGILAVFWLATSFNRDLSKWNTGVVTNMKRSECRCSC